MKWKDIKVGDILEVRLKSRSTEQHMERVIQAAPAEILTELLFPEMYTEDGGIQGVDQNFIYSLVPPAKIAFALDRLKLVDEIMRYTSETIDWEA